MACALVSPAGLGMKNTKLNEYNLLCLRVTSHSLR